MATYNIHLEIHREKNWRGPFYVVSATASEVRARARTAGIVLLDVSTAFNNTDDAVGDTAYDVRFSWGDDAVENEVIVAALEAVGLSRERLAGALREAIEACDFMA